MDLSTIKNKSNWGVATDTINSNFTKVATDIDKMKYAAYNSKLYPSLSKLKEEIPSPKVGDWAIVGNTIPGDIYRCEVSGEWKATGEQGGGFAMEVVEKHVTENYSNVFNNAQNVVNNPDNEDIQSVGEVGKEVIQFADKDYDSSSFSGLGRVYVRKNISASRNVLTQEMINKTNTRYIIQYDYNLNGGTINLPEGCVLDFQGGSFDNGTIIGNYTSIVGDKKIFGLSMSFGGTFHLTDAKAMWFGVLPDIDNISPYIKLAIAFCMQTNIKNMVMPSGTLNVKEPIVIGNGERDGWFITIKGAGANETRGTFFKIYNGAYIKIDQKNDNYGALRSGGIFDCCFQSESSGTNRCIIITGGNAYSIVRCHFSLFDTAIALTGSTYFTKISQCLFEICTNGVISLPSGDADFKDGGANNNIIEGCWFTYCSNNPVNTGTSEMWHISDCDFEGSNGTIELSSQNTITNCRVERNDVTTPDIVMGSGNIVDVRLHYAGGSPTEWKIVVNGMYNKVTATFNGFIPFALVSYGTRNDFNITCTKSSYFTNKLTPLFLFDPEDTFVMNGYSNKDKVYSQNRITYSDFTVSNEVLATYNGMDCRKLTKTNTNVSTIEESECTELYISGKIYFKPTSTSDRIDIRLLNHYVSITNAEKWFQFIQCINLVESLAYTSKDYRLYDLTSLVDVTIIDLVFSKKPFFKGAPWWLSSHGDSYDYIGDDGTIINSKQSNFNLKFYLDRCYFTYYILCGVFTKKIVYKNILGKQYTYIGSDTFSEYPSGRKILRSIPYIDGAVGGLTSCKVDLIDIANNKLASAYCTKSGSDYSIYPIYNDDGLTINLVNTNGTLDVSGLSNTYCVWITEMRKGDTVYSVVNGKNISWDGEKWTNLDGTEL